MSVTTVRPKKIRIGDLLIEHKIISQEQLTSALADQKKSGRKLGRVLIENGYLTRGPAARFPGAPAQRPVHRSQALPRSSPRPCGSSPRSHARRFRALALEDARDALLVGMADPDRHLRLRRADARAAPADRAGGGAPRPTCSRPSTCMYRRTDEISGLAQELDQELSASDVDLGALVATDGVDRRAGGQAARRPCSRMRCR
ncbi:MAG: hypothetical protein MZV65_20370 [Chromatiales bacterium]|nr:hypothetical protein [Chromatiales bacterium]